jgi:hypothetical protein
MISVANGFRFVAGRGAQRILCYYHKAAAAVDLTKITTLALLQLVLISFQWDEGIEVCVISKY